MSRDGRAGLTAGKKLGFSVLVALVLLAVLEAGLRLSYPHSQEERDPTRWEAGPVPVVPYSKMRCVRTDPHRGYAFQPSCDGEHPEEFHVNSLGFKGREIERRKPSAAITRVFCLGNSTTVYPASCSYDMPLEKLLNDARSGKTYEVVNAGVHGYKASQSVSWVRTEILDMDPDVIVFFHLWNDLWTAPLDKAQDVGLASTFEPRWWCRSHVVNLLRLFYWRDVANRIGLRNPGDSHERVFPLQYPVEFTDSILNLSAMARERGVKLVLMTQPSLLDRGILERKARDPDFLARLRKRILLAPGYDSVGDLVDTIDYMNSLVVRIARENDLPLVDIATIVRERYSDEERLDHFVADVMHFDCEVHALVARELAKRLAAEGL